MRYSSFLITASIAASSQTLAQPSSDAMTNEVTDNVATEYADCSAYFSIVQGAFASSGKSPQSIKFKEASDRAAEFSLMSAQRSRTAEMATKVTLARIEMSMKDMQKTIGNNYSNISLLMNKHSDICVEALTDSAKIIKRWTDKISEKYGVNEKK